MCIFILEIKAFLAWFWTKHAQSVMCETWSNCDWCDTIWHFSRNSGGLSVMHTQLKSRETTHEDRWVEITQKTHISSITFYPYYSNTLWIPKINSLIHLRRYNFKYIDIFTYVDNRINTIYPQMTFRFFLHDYQCYFIPLSTQAGGNILHVFQPMVLMRHQRLVDEHSRWHILKILFYKYTWPVTNDWEWRVIYT